LANPSETAVTTARTAPALNTWISAAAAARAPVHVGAVINTVASATVVVLPIAHLRAPSSLETVGMSIAPAASDARNRLTALAARI
jgi:hypothetical protein